MTHVPDPFKSAFGELPPALGRLGQHFLSDPAILARIADALELSGDETVIEIGAGRGSLTEHLQPRCRRLVAIEIDRALVPLLRSRFSGRENLEVVEGDALKISLGTLAGGPYKLAGNVPYYITTPLIFHSLIPPRPDAAVFLVQKEVAQRASASPGNRNYGALSVNLQALVTVELLFVVGPGAFTPRPQVDSALVRLRPLEKTIVDPADEGRFRALVQGAFAQRRKQLQKILRGTHSLSPEHAHRVIREASLDPSARPETLSPADFERLLRALENR